MAAVTGEAEPRAGSYQGEPAAGGRPAPGAGRSAHRSLIDDATAETIDGRLPPELGLAEVRDADGAPAWALVAPGLSIPPRAGTCPYRGLMAFRSEDGDLFFGREEVVASILDRLLDGGFMAVVGASGSGKSSLVRAGARSGVPPGARRAGRGDDARLGSGRGARAFALRRAALAPDRRPAGGGVHALSGRSEPGPSSSMP